MEIERKYLLSQLPDAKPTKVYRMEQAYLCDAPVLRVRRRVCLPDGTAECFLTVKGGGKIVRQEFELPISETKYEQLKAKHEGRVICKKRYLYPLYDAYVAEVDVFEKEYEGLILAEVEFQDEEAMARFVAPDWFGPDVSWDRRYHTSVMALGKEEQA